MLNQDNLTFAHFHSAWTPDDIKQEQLEAPAKIYVPSKVVSVGYRVVKDETVGFLLVGQVARCKMCDQFNGKIARQIVRGRLAKRGPAFSIPIEDDFKPREIYLMLEEKFHPDFGVDVEP